MQVKKQLGKGKTIAKNQRKQKLFLWKVNKTDSESEDPITDRKENLRTLSEHYEQLSANKLDNLEEGSKFPETHKIPKQIQEEIENLGKEI